VIDRARRLESAAAGGRRYEAEVRTLAPASARSAEAEAIELEEKARARAELDRALAEINPRYRRVVELRLIEDRSRDECAALLGVTVAHLDVLVHRALAALRTRMSPRASTT